MFLTRLYDATNNVVANTKILWTLMWCGNSHGINMCDTYVGNNAEFEQACSK